MTNQDANRQTGSSSQGRIRKTLLRLLGIETRSRIARIETGHGAMLEIIDSMLEWIRKAERHLAALQHDHEKQLAAVHSLIESNVEWIRNAESHLSSLQESHERIHDSLGTTLRADQVEVTTSWMRGAEAHLAGLQAESERLCSLSRRLGEQLTRVIALTAHMEARMEDLERSDTEIAVALARTQVSKPDR